MAIMGGDVRWVGNERGLGRPTEWSATALAPGVYSYADKENARLGLVAMSDDLGSRALLAKAHKLYWYPSEVDVSIRRGWFYHSTEDATVKSLAQLSDIYFRSVGYNSVLLLNIPPDRRGLIHEADASRLGEFADYIRRMQADNRVENGQRIVTLSPGAGCEYALKPGSRINVVMLQEDIARGQRIERFKVEALTGKGWQSVAQGTTVGYKRMLRFVETQASAIRVTVFNSRGRAFLTRVAAYYAEPVADDHAAAPGELNSLPRTQWKQLSASPWSSTWGARSV